MTFSCALQPKVLSPEAWKMAKAAKALQVRRASSVGTEVPAESVEANRRNLMLGRVSHAPPNPVVLLWIRMPAGTANMS